MSKTKAPLVNQPSAKPSRKVLIGAIAGIFAAALNALLSWLLESYPGFAWLNEPQVRSAVPILAGTAAAYLFRERGHPPPPGDDELAGDGGDIFPFPNGS